MYNFAFLIASGILDGSFKRMIYCLRERLKVAIAGKQYLVDKILCDVYVYCFISDKNVRRIAGAAGFIDSREYFALSQVSSMRVSCV